MDTQTNTNVYDRDGHPRRERALEMAEKYRAGATLQEIGDYYGISRERVRQIMRWELGIRARDGGRAQRATAKRKAAEARRDTNCRARYGMPLAEFKRVQQYLDAAGKDPRKRFYEQKGNAQTRQIEWDLTFAEWWKVWESSGKWGERGRGASGYVMARHSDSGPYATGNVKIIPANDNQREYIRRYWKQVRGGQRPMPVHTRKDRTHCAHGHPFTPENLYISPRGARNCRACNRAACARYNAQHRE